jgi:hypothetical protein
MGLFVGKSAWRALATSCQTEESDTPLLDVKGSPSNLHPLAKDRYLIVTFL